MRIAMFSVVLFTCLSAFAQSGMPPCDGDIALVRISQIKPGGTMDGFLAAVAAQKAWYRTNGSNDNEIVVSRVWEADQSTGQGKYSDSVAITYHVRPPAVATLPNRGDAAWKAFTKLFQDNSEIKNQYTTCTLKTRK